MFTAEMARQGNNDELDRRIKAAVGSGAGNSAYLRIYIEDAFFHRIEEELVSRGFINVQVPDVIFLKGDVYFEWET